MATLAENYEKGVRKAVRFMMHRMGFKPVALDNGGPTYTLEGNLSSETIVKEATATDCATVTFTRGDERVRLFFVGGNSINETVADASWNNKVAEQVVDDLFCHFD